MNNVKKINNIYSEKRNNLATLIQKQYKGFSFRKQNKKLNQDNKLKRVAIIKIQRRTRGM